VNRLIQAEFSKLFTTKLWLWLLLGGFALTALFMSFTIGFDGSAGNNAPRLNTAEGQRNLFSVPAVAGVFGLILGAVGITGEFRHQTVTPTFLATPHRGRVVIAKLIAYALAGIGYGIATVILAIAIGLTWLSAKNIDVSLGSNGIPGTLIGVVLGVAVYSLLGVGLGALIRNQIAAIVGALVYLFVIEGFLQAIPKVRDYYKYFPGGANSALTKQTQPNLTLLAQYQGGLLLVAYGLVFAILGTWLAMRRDVT
jgi:ABC-type transport system involved in multi-copper enzyme maturation permease subunit